MMTSLLCIVFSCICFALEIILVICSSDGVSNAPTEIATLDLIGSKMCLKECNYRAGSCKSVRYAQVHLKCVLYETDITSLSDIADHGYWNFGETSLERAKVRFLHMQGIPFFLCYHQQLKTIIKFNIKSYLFNIHFVG